MHFERHLPFKIDKIIFFQENLKNISEVVFGKSYFWKNSTDKKA